MSGEDVGRRRRYRGKVKCKRVETDRSDWRHRVVPSRGEGRASRSISYAVVAVIPLLRYIYRTSGHYRPPASPVPLSVHAKSRSFIPYRSRIILAIHLSSIRTNSIRRSQHLFLLVISMLFIFLPDAKALLFRSLIESCMSRS